MLLPVFHRSLYQSCKDPVSLTYIHSWACHLGLICSRDFVITDVPKPPPQEVTALSHTFPLLASSRCSTGLSPGTAACSSPSSSSPRVGRFLPLFHKSRQPLFASTSPIIGRSRHRQGYHLHATSNKNSSSTISPMILSVR